MSGHIRPTSQRGWRVRSGTPNDAGDLAQLHVEVWEDAYRDLMPASIFERRRARIDEREARWRQILSDGATRTLVAEHEGARVGFACAGPPRDPDVGVDEELRALYLRSSWWGRGLGHSLLTSIIDDRAAYLWVLRGNERAIHFYRKHRFAEDGATRSDDYGTELRMLRHTTAE